MEIPDYLNYLTSYLSIIELITEYLNAIFLFFLIIGFILCYINDDLFSFKKKLANVLIYFGSIKIIIDLIAFFAIYAFSKMNTFHISNMLTLDIRNLESLSIIELLLFELCFGISPLIIGLLIKNFLKINRSKLKVGNYLLENFGKSGIDESIFFIIKIEKDLVYLKHYRNDSSLDKIEPYHIIIQKLKMGIYNFGDK